MPSISDQVDKLKVVANVQPSENIDNSTLERFVQESVFEHDSNFSSINDVPVAELSLVNKLAWIRLSYLRASRHMGGNLTTDRSGYGQDRDGPFEKYLQLAKRLRKEYEDESQKFTGDSVVSGTVTKPSMFTGEFFGENTLPKLAPPALNVSKFDNSSAVLNWTAVLSERFASYKVYSSELPNTVKLWNVSGTNIGVADYVSLIKEIQDSKQLSIRVGGMNPAIPFYFLVGVTDVNGFTSFSNEVSIQLNTI